MKTFLPIVVIILLFQINTTCAEESSLHDKYFYAVLDAQIESIKTGEYRTMDRIYDLEKNSNRADELLVELLDYYVGSAVVFTLYEFITKRNNKMIPLLLNKRKSKLSCLEKYKSICADSIQDRNEMIDELTGLIKKGEVISD